MGKSNAARAREAVAAAAAEPGTARLRAEVEAGTAEAPEIPEAARDLPPGVAWGWLCGQVVRVKNYLDWPTVAIVHERQSDYETWAAYCLFEDDYENVWRPLAPTVRQVYEFFNSWRANSGQDVGESAASQGS